MPAAIPKRSKWLLKIYSLLWLLAIPVLFLNKRLRQGFSQRLLLRAKAHRYQIWLQAASAGEAALAKEIINNFQTSDTLHILATTWTKQGLDILSTCKPQKNVTLQPAYCPFDLPLLMSRALKLFNPQVVVLLETELWPGLLYSCKKSATPVLLLNARLTRKSLAGYISFSGFWQSLAPEQIYAVSEQEVKRYELVFNQNKISSMPNIKFDRCQLEDAPIAYVRNELSKFIKAQSQFVVLGSIRKEEEKLVLKTICELLDNRPMTIVGLFPRHMHRLHSWESFLAEKNIHWVHRSTLGEDYVQPGTVILWDRFGELEQAYALARAAYVGGSLVPLGGQNFLEPLAQGVMPCIGPFWDNFAWIGEEIVAKGLVHQVSSQQELTQCLINILKRNPTREKVYARFQEYIAEHQGGTAFCCTRIQSVLDAHQVADS